MMKRLTVLLLVCGFFIAESLTAQEETYLCIGYHWSNEDDYGRFRYDMQARCAIMARMGAWVFAYDMLGYGETNYVNHHHPDALTIQCITGIRILDYFSGEQEINQKRIAITGASGGGTQSFLLTAIDQRIRVSVPTVQVSSYSKNLPSVWSD